MSVSLTTLTGPIYMPNGATPVGGRVSFELSSWDREEGEALIVSGPIYSNIDENGQFSVELFTTTEGTNTVNYKMYVLWEDSELSQSYVNDVYVSSPVPHYTKKYIGSFALAGAGPFQVSDLNIVSELELNSFDVLLECQAYSLVAQAAANSASQAVAEVLGLSVDAYGAVGDGSTDDGAAILAALTAAEGRLVIGRAGAVYCIGSAISYTGGVSLDLSMARVFVNAPIRPFLFSASGEGPFSLSANYGGSTSLSATGLTTAPEPGQRIVISSNARDPGNRHEGTANATQYRVAEDAFVGIGSTTSSIVLTGPLQFTTGVNADPAESDMVASYTTANGARIAVLGNETCDLKLPVIEFEAGHAASGTWRSEAVQVRGYTKPRIEFGGVVNGYGPGLTLNGTYGAHVVGFRPMNLENDLGQGQYGYGVNDQGTASLIEGLATANTRHGYTTSKGASTIDPSDIWVMTGLGRARGATVISQQSFGDTSSSVDTHQCADGVSHLSPFISGCATYGIAARGRNVLFDKPRIRASAAGANIFTEWDSSDGVELNNSRAKEWMTSAQIVAPDFGTSGHSIHVSIASLSLQGPGSYVQFAMPEWAKFEGGTDVVISGHHGAVLSDAGGNDGSALITLTAPHASAADAFPTTRCVIEEGAVVELDAQGVTSTGIIGVSAATGAELIVRGTLRLTLPASSTLFSGSGTIRCEGKGVIEYTMTGSSAIAGSGLAGRSVRVVHTASGDVFDGTGTNNSAWNGYNRVLDVDAGGVSVRGDSPVLFLDDLDTALSNGETSGRLIFKTRDADGGVKEALTLQGVGRGTTGDLSLEVKLGSTTMLTITDTSFSATGNVYSAGLLAGVVPFADRAAAIAATIPLVHQSIAYFGPNGSILQFVRDASGTALTTAGGATWSPAGDATPEHWGAVVTGLVGDQVAIAACLQWAIDNQRHVVMRGFYGLSDEVYADYNGYLNVTANGAKFIALTGFPTDKRMIRVQGAPSGATTFWWNGGWWDGSKMPYAGPLGQGNFFEVVTGNSVGLRRVHIEGMYAGEDWREGMAGGDSGLYINANWTDVDLGVMQGFVDLGYYLTSGSTGTSTDANRREGHKLRGTFIKCWRGASAKRAARVLDVEITCIDCLGGWNDSPADIGGVTPDRADYDGQIKVTAIRTQWAINGSRPYSIKYDCMQTDLGVYLPTVGAVPMYRSTEGGYRFQGANKCHGVLSANGVNPDVIANGANPQNFRGVEFEDAAAGVGCFDNRFDLTCYNIYRVVYEQDSSDRNVVDYRSDTNLVSKVGLNSYFTRITNPSALGNITTGTIAAGDVTTGNLTASGDVLVSNGNLRVTKVNNSGTTPATVSVRDGDASVAGGQPIGRYDWISNVSGVEQAAAYIEARARNTTGRSSLFFSAGYAGSLADVMELRDDALSVAVAATLAAGLTVSGGTVTLPAGSVTRASLANGTALSIIGRASNSTGAVADIAAGTDHQVLRRSGTTLGFGALELAQADATTGELPVNRGGTGAATAPDARTNLGLGNAAVATVTTDASDTTAGRLLAVGAGAAQLDATLYRKANILGTVSQSAGVPTGAVIERGSNANGSYVRFADGTQICWQTQTITATIATAYFGGFRSSTTTWTFPAEFSVAPVVNGSFANFTSMPALIGTVSATSAGWAASAVASQASATRDVLLFAIGRWF